MRRIGEQRAGRRHLAVAQIDGGRGRPVLAEQLLHRGDGGVGALDQRMAVARHRRSRARARRRAAWCRSRAAASSRCRTCRARRRRAGRCRASCRGRGCGNARWWRRPAPGPGRRSPRTRPCARRSRITGTSPPGPLRCGSTTCSVNAVATAASKALPPFSSIAMPTAVAIQWVEVTTPNVPSISGRVVKGLGLTLLMRALRRFTGAASGDQAVYTALRGRPRVGVTHHRRGRIAAGAGDRCTRTAGAPPAVQSPERPSMPNVAVRISPRGGRSGSRSLHRRCTVRHRPR